MITFSRDKQNGEGGGWVDPGIWKWRGEKKSWLIRSMLLSVNHKTVHNNIMWFEDILNAGDWLHVLLTIIITDNIVYFVAHVY